jgi:class 3 adenylate cyclase
VFWGAQNLRQRELQMAKVDRWLADLGLGQYASAFAAQDIDFSLLSQLGDADLREIGVGSLGHRKKLLQAIAELAARLPESVSATAPEAPNAATTQNSHAAERRQLTVMFCDLVGSTALSGRLDPEELRMAVRSYHEAVAAAVARFDGYVAQLLGDGVLAYFGYPRAHEDDPERAVRASLAAIAAVGELPEVAGNALRARIGIATGQVVVGQIGTGTPAATPSAMGETPNLAARLQGEAPEMGIVISESTRQLLGETFHL